MEDLVSDEIEQMYEVFRDLLDSGTPEEAVKKLEVLRIDQDTIQRIIEMHEQHTIRIKELEEPRSVVLDNRDTWYTGPRPKDKCWPAMVERLRQDHGWAADSPSMTSLDSSSTRIVSLLSHPREKQFSTRGLVVGYVQSGKTTNFTAVMSKAADRGYKLFIVLSGIHNGLRRQTQDRLVKQLVQANPTRWSQLTGLDRDFTPGNNAASYFGKSNRTHVLCVVKKNATVLRKLSEWLGSAADYLQDCPALVIDDEADQATVATKSINPLIREILDRLPKSAYVGYTASPFANLLIDPSAENDLYPEHFIVNLPSPKGQGYFGTEVLFGRYALDGEDPTEVDDGYDMIRDVPEDDVPLREAVEACRCRGIRPGDHGNIAGCHPILLALHRSAAGARWRQPALHHAHPHQCQHHCSQQLPVRHLSCSEESLAATLGDTGVVDELHNAVGRGDEQGSRRGIRGGPGSFRRGTRRTAAVSLMTAASSWTTPAVRTGWTMRTVRWWPSRWVVTPSPAGLTLEGLTVSYFVRAVSAYDTLLQMGRWFGFRNGYADLPRIWMTDGTAGVVPAPGHGRGGDASGHRHLHDRGQDADDVRRATAYAPGIACHCGREDEGCGPCCLGIRRTACSDALLPNGPGVAQPKPAGRQGPCDQGPARPQPSAKHVRKRGAS